MLFKVGAVFEYVNIFVDRTPTEHWTLMALLTWILQATMYRKVKEIICWDVLDIAKSNSSPSWGSPIQLGRWFGHKRLSIGFILLTPWRYIWLTFQASSFFFFLDYFVMISVSQHWMVILQPTKQGTVSKSDCPFKVLFTPVCFKIKCFF